MDLGIGGLTSSVIGMALDGLSLRHEAIASNIANINTAGYRPIKVGFEDQLASVVAAARSNPAVAVSVITPNVGHEAVTNPASSAMRLDMNTVLLNQNTLQYQALISGLDKYMSTIALATNDGRR
ncbi:flagellar basal body rod protein FlgB [Methylobacillus pratensis]